MEREKEVTDKHLMRVARLFEAQNIVLLTAELSLNTIELQKRQADYGDLGLTVVMLMILHDWKTNTKNNKIIPTMGLLKTHLDEVTHDKHILCKVRIFALGLKLSLFAHKMSMAFKN